MNEGNGDDVGSEGFQEQFLAGEQKQAEMISKYKESRRKTTQGKKELEQLAALQKKYSKLCL